MFICLDETEDGFKPSLLSTFRKIQSGYLHGVRYAKTFLLSHYRKFFFYSWFNVYLNSNLSPSITNLISKTDTRKQFLGCFREPNRSTLF